jgi:hypothetical protein
MYEQLSETWGRMIEHEIMVWARFQAYWLQKDLPVFALRYEDLILHQEVREGREDRSRMNASSSSYSIVVASDARFIVSPPSELLPWVL